MPKSIFGINIFIAINKIFFTCIIWRIDIDKVYFSLMCLFKQL